MTLTVGDDFDTVEDDFETVGDDSETVEDDSETVEDDFETVEDDSETVEDDSETVEDDFETVEDDSETIEIDSVQDTAGHSEAAAVLGSLSVHRAPLRVQVHALDTAPSSVPSFCQVSRFTLTIVM